jgi:hypothetical protein
MNWFQKIATKMLWPRIKQFLIDHVKSEETQKKYVALINKKLDVPNLSEDAEAKLLNQVYDAGQEALIEIIENFDVEKIG